MASLVAWAVSAQAGRRVFYEQLDSHPARAGRRHNGVGTERVPGIPRNQLHMLAYSLGSSDRHCPAASDVLTTGTRWDRSSSRFGESFPAWVADYRGNISSSLAEHLERLLGEDRAVRRAFQQRAKDAVFTDTLTPRRMIAAFSRFLVVPPIPCGTSFVEHRSHGAVLLPGRNDDVVEVAAESGAEPARARSL